MFAAALGLWWRRHRRGAVCPSGATLSALGDAVASSPAGATGKTVTHTGVTTSNNPTGIGQLTTFTATVTPIPDGGTVAFRADTTVLGIHHITAGFTGTTDFPALHVGLLHGRVVSG